MLDDDGVLTISGNEEIQEGTFENNSNIKRVIIEDGIKGIGDLAFFRCSSLTNVKIPDSVKDIRVNPFSDCVIQRLACSLEETLTSLFLVEGVEWIMFSHAAGALPGAIRS